MWATVPGLRRPASPAPDIVRNLLGTVKLSSYSQARFAGIVNGTPSLSPRRCREQETEADGVRYAFLFRSYSGSDRCRNDRLSPGTISALCVIPTFACPIQVERKACLPRRPAPPVSATGQRPINRVIFAAIDLQTGVIVRPQSSKVSVEIRGFATCKTFKALRSSSERPTKPRILTGMSKPKRIVGSGMRSLPSRSGLRCREGTFRPPSRYRGMTPPGERALHDSANPTHGKDRMPDPTMRFGLLMRREDSGGFGRSLRRRSHALKGSSRKPRYFKTVTFDDWDARITPCVRSWREYYSVIRRWPV